MPWYLYLAFKQLFPTGKRLPFLTAISVAGVALGVALLVIVTSVMTGFEYDIKRMITDTEGEVQIKAQGYIEDYAPILRAVEKAPGVAAATPYASGYVGIECRGHPAYPEMRGLDLATIGKVTRLADYVRAGSLDDLDDGSVILSSVLAETIGARVGDAIDIYSPLLLQKLSRNEIFMPRTVRVVGILEIGHQQLDSSRLYCTLRLAQDLYGLGTAVHGIDVRLKPGVNEDDAAAAINRILPADVRAFSWMDSFSDFLWAVAMEKNMIFFLLLFIVIVAAFSVTSSLLISVVRKTREIGLFGALGGSPLEIAAVFCSQAFAIGVAGTAAGLGLGFAALAFRNDLVRAVERITQRPEVLQRIYQVGELPSHTDSGTLWAIILLTIAIATIAGLLPAWRAARLKPVEALRSE